MNYYSAYISHPDFPETRQRWIALSDEEVEAYRNFIEQELCKFKAAYPDDADDEELWQDWLDDAFAEADFRVEIGGMNPVPAHVEYIDLDNPKTDENN